MPDASLWQGRQAGKQLQDPRQSRARGFGARFLRLSAFRGGHSIPWEGGVEPSCSAGACHTKAACRQALGDPGRTPGAPRCTSVL